jgi:DNA (cytosine-5)-methyltransferase 1
MKTLSLKALDLYCGSGGAALGLMQAGLYVDGVDIEPMPRYLGDRFIWADALAHLEKLIKSGEIAEYAIIWASPPCKFFTELGRSFEIKKHNIDLITPTRPLLEASGLPWVIENVENAKRVLRDPVMLCATMFPGLLQTETHALRRHRLFEASFPITAPGPCQHKHGKRTGGVYGGHGRDRVRPVGADAPNREHASGSNLSREDQFILMGVPVGSMTLSELSESIPPIYSKHIAEQWLKQAGIGPLPPRTRRFIETPKPATPPAPIAEAPAPPVLIALPAIVYCTTFAAAETMVKEMVSDAGGGHVAIDLETAPVETEAARVKALAVERAAAVGALQAAKKAKAPFDDLKTAAKLLEARVKFAAAAALDPARSRIRLMQVYGGAKRVAVIDVFKAGEKALALVEGLDAIIHNAAFELSQLEARGVELGDVQCTLQAARLTLGERHTALEVVAKSYLHVDLDKGAQLSDWSAHDLTPVQIEYAAADAVAAHRIAQAIFPTLGPQTSAYEIQIAAVPAVARMKRRGFKLNLAAHAALMINLEAKRRELHAAYTAACVEAGLSGPVTQVPKTPTAKEATLKVILSSGELATWERTEKSGALSTSRASLRRAQRYPPIAKLVELSQDPRRSAGARSDGGERGRSRHRRL